MPEYKVTKYLM